MDPHKLNFSDRRVIFLDIDGVLNSGRSAKALGHPGNPRSPYFLDPVAVRLMQRTVEETESLVVLSSTWRQSGTPAKAQMWMALYGWYNAPIIDRTPLRTSGNGYAWGGRSPKRGEIIKRWVDQHSPRKYLIIDDNNDMLEGQPLIQTNSKIGYTQNHHSRALGYLKHDMPITLN